MYQGWSDSELYNERELAERELGDAISMLFSLNANGWDDLPVDVYTAARARTLAHVRAIINEVLPARDSDGAGGHRGGVRMGTKIPHP